MPKIALTNGSGLILPQVAFWSPGSSVGTLLPTLQPSNPYSFATAEGMNDGGTIAGFSGGAPTAWTAGTPAALGTFGLADDAGGYAWVVNDAGQIGCQVLHGSAGVYAEQLFIWQGGSFSALPSLPTGFSPNFGDGHCNLSGINATGDIVGDHWLPNAYNVAALWSGGQVYDLNFQLTGSNAGDWTTLMTATGINDCGLDRGKPACSAACRRSSCSPR